MSTEAEKRAYAEKIARDWAERGKLLRGGWETYRRLMLPADMARIIATDPVQAAEAMEAALRKVFYLGADHLWSSAFAAVDNGPGESAGELRRMANIHQELEAFQLELLSQHKAGNA